MFNLVFSLSLIIIGFLSSFYLFYRKPMLIIKKPKVDKPISIIIPVRNEEKSIGLLLYDLMNQNYQNIEIIVADDGSTDQTKNIVKKYNVKYILIDQNEKPSDYLGKSWAIEKASYYASHDILLFLDADVRLTYNAIESLIAQYEVSQKVISVQPYHVTKKHYEQLSMPFNLVSLAANNTSTPKPKPIGLFGPCILISTSDYKKINRHYEVRMSIIEDVSFGAVLKKYNIAYQCFIGTDLIKYRMYPSGFMSLYYGWTKNIAYGALKTPILLALTIFLFVASILATPIGIIDSTIKNNYTLLYIYIVIYLIWFIRLLVILKSVGKYKFWTTILFPISFTYFTLITFISLIKKFFNIPVKWKDRKIKVDK